VITSSPTQPIEEIHEMKTNNSIQPTTVKKNKTTQCDVRPRIIALGDSHARGIAGELRHHSNQQFNIIGYVKPNAKLRDLITTAKIELSKLTKKDTIILMGGSNDTETKEQGNNITLIRNFLEGTHNTNVKVLEVPVRYDVGIQSTINRQIESYNKKLHKIIKGYMHVQLIKVTTNREEFTKHGLHLNWKGKEKMTNELLKYLTITQKKQESVTIYLPWKSETKEIDVRNVKTEKVHVAPYVSIVTNDSKDIVSQKKSAGR